MKNNNIELAKFNRQPHGTSSQRLLFPDKWGMTQRDRYMNLCCGVISFTLVTYRMVAYLGGAGGGMCRCQGIRYQYQISVSDQSEGNM